MEECKEVNRIKSECCRGSFHVLVAIPSKMESRRIYEHLERQSQLGGM